MEDQFFIRRFEIAEKELTRRKDAKVIGSVKVFEKMIELAVNAGRKFPHLADDKFAKDVLAVGLGNNSIYFIEEDHKESTNEEDDN